MKRLTLYIYILALLASIFIGSSFYIKQNDSNNYKLYSVFIFKFTQYFEWPETYSQGDFVIGILGKTPLYAELQAMSKVKKIGERRIRVKQYLTPDMIREKCHMLFIAKDNSRDLKESLSIFSSEPTLVISEREGLAKMGSMVNFVIRSNRIQLELNKGQIDRSKLKVSNNLIKVAATVY